MTIYLSGKVKQSKNKYEIKQCCFNVRPLLKVENVVEPKPYEIQYKRESRTENFLRQLFMYSNLNYI